MAYKKLTEYHSGNLRFSQTKNLTHVLVTEGYQDEKVIAEFYIPLQNSQFRIVELAKKRLEGKGIRVKHIVLCTEDSFKCKNRMGL